MFSILLGVFRVILILSLFSSEKQSNASADRRGEGHSGRWLDIMFMLKYGDYVYELIYAECSHINCTEYKK